METLYQPRVQSIVDMKCFHGRDTELARVFSYINKSAPSNLSIVGQRRIGKSWLLQKICFDQDLQKKFLGGNHDLYTFVYWNIQESLPQDPEQFYSQILERIFDSLPTQVSVPLLEKGQKLTGCYERLKFVVDKLRELRRHVVVLLDEYSVVLQNRNFDTNYLSNMRKLLGGPSLTAITATYRTLREECQHVPDSPLYNIFVKIPLGLFTETEAQQFVQQPLREMGIVVDADAVTKIVDLVGFHPCFLSQFCHDLMLQSTSSSSQIRVTDVTKLEHQISLALSDDFDYYWDHLSLVEHETLLSIIDGNSNTVTKKPLLNKLESYGLIRILPDKTLVIFSDLFRDYIETNKSAGYFIAEYFSNVDFSSSGFSRLCRNLMALPLHMPEAIRTYLLRAIAEMHDHPETAISICGRQILDPLIEVVAEKGFDSRYDSRLEEQNEAIRRLESENRQRKKVPDDFLMHMHRIRRSGNHPSHFHTNKESCTTGHAFLTILETIHFAEEVYSRFTN